MSSSPLSYLFQEDLYSIPAKVTVVLNKQWSTYSVEHQVLLSKILGSVKLSTASVQILSAEKFEPSMIPSNTASRVLIFGSQTDPAMVPYQSNQAHGFTVIKADDLPELDDQKKKNLWVALKAMFGV